MTTLKYDLRLFKYLKKATKMKEIKINKNRNSGGKGTNFKTL